MIYKLRSNYQYFPLYHNFLNKNPKIPTKKPHTTEEPYLRTLSKEKSPVLYSKALSVLFWSLPVNFSYIHEELITKKQQPKNPRKQKQNKQTNQTNKNTPTKVKTIKKSKHTNKQQFKLHKDLYCKGGETLEEDVQRSSGCPIPRNV